MTRVGNRILVGSVLVAAGVAQAQEALPRFEVASVKPSAGPTGERGQPGGRYTATRTVRFFIADAFFFGTPMQMSRVIGGPPWIDSNLYEINAQASPPWPRSPDGPPRELFLMIRSVLLERFKLKTHMETREMPVYELVLARPDGRLGPRLQPSEAKCEAAMAAVQAGEPLPPRQPNEPPPCGLMGGPVRTLAGGATMQQFAAHLSNRVERLVVDKTGLTGRFAFELVFTPVVMPTAPPPAGLSPADPQGPSLFIALQEQLGLELISVTRPVDVVVIDSIEPPTPD